MDPHLAHYTGNKQPFTRCCSAGYTGYRFYLVAESIDSSQEHGHVSRPPALYMVRSDTCLVGRAHAAAQPALPLLPGMPSVCSPHSPHLLYASTNQRQQVDIRVFVNMPEANETTEGSVPNYAGLMTYLHDHMSKGGELTAGLGRAGRWLAWAEAAGGLAAACARAASPRRCALRLQHRPLHPFCPRESGANTWVQPPSHHHSAPRRHAVRARRARPDAHAGPPGHAGPRR